MKNKNSDTRVIALVGEAFGIAVWIFVALVVWVIAGVPAAGISK